MFVFFYCFIPSILICLFSLLGSLLCLFYFFLSLFSCLLFCVLLPSFSWSLFLYPLLSFFVFMSYVFLLFSLRSIRSFFFNSLLFPCSLWFFLPFPCFFSWNSHIYFFSFPYSCILFFPYVLLIFFYSLLLLFHSYCILLPSFSYPIFRCFHSCLCYLGFVLAYFNISVI